jgi:Ca2+:H+ antiporter
MKQHFYQDDEVTGSTRYPEEVTNLPSNVREKMHLGDRMHFRRKKHDEETATVSPTSSVERDGEVAAAHANREQSHHEEEEEEEEEVPQMNVIVTIVGPIDTAVELG